MSYHLRSEEDLPVEFRAGTLTLNSTTDNKQTTDNNAKVDSAKTESDKTDNTTKTNSNNNDCYWGSAFISPLTSIPNKITETLWSKKPEENENKTEPNPNSSNTIQQAICIIEDPNNFFTFREHVIQQAIKECSEQFLDPEFDGPLIAAFLLTQINHWDSDKERLLLLTPKSLVTAKYDFIALKRLGYRKLPLELIDQVLIGDLMYPQGSLIPKMNGIAEGVSNIFETCLFSRLSQNDSQKPVSNIYQPRDRNMRGLRLIWNDGKPLNFSGKWNPFNDNIPFCTFTFHPLYFNKDFTDEKQKNLYDLDLFVDRICDAITSLKDNNEKTRKCSIHHMNIVLQNYIGLGAIIHNRNSLGFFKVRGKFSF